MSKFGWVAAGAIVLATTAASSAYANTYDFSYVADSSPNSNGLTSASGVFTTSNTETNGFYKVTGISGERGSFAITGLSSYASADQRLYTAAPYVDSFGISFKDASGASYNLFDMNGVFELSSKVTRAGFPFYGVPVTLTVTQVPVPEPVSLALLGTGLVGLGLARRRRT